MKLKSVKKTKKGNKLVKKYYICGIKYLYKSWSDTERKTRIFGITVSHHYKKLPAELNKTDFLNTEKYDSQKIFEVAQGKKIDVVIPVYNGFEFLEKLFASLITNTDVEWHAFVVNDHSPDRRVSDFLKLQQKNLNSRMTLIENSENLGFVKSVNRALEQCSHDVVLINTDVVLPKNWASRLLYPIFTDPKVGSVTPFSNAATIFSIPKINQNCVLDVDLEVVNNAFKQIHCDFRQFKLSTGVGFCMAMSRRAIKEIGLLDEIFGKGYGEENDWCQRAIKNGFYNTLVPNLFVWHKHGGTFLPKEKIDLINNHLQIIAKRHPTYFSQTEKNLKDPIFILTRFWAELLYLNEKATKTVLWIQHCWGGGAETYLQRQIKSDCEINLHIVVRNVRKSPALTIEFVHGDCNNKILLNLVELNCILEQTKIHEIRLNNLAGYSSLTDVADLISKTKKMNNCQVKYFLHDYQCICPTITLLDNGNYCGVGSVNNCDCKQCLTNNKNNQLDYTDIDAYRDFYLKLFNNLVDNVITFSRPSVKILLNIFPNLKEKIELIPHSVPRLDYKTYLTHKSSYTVGVLGAIGVPKGAEILEQFDKHLPAHPEIKLIIIGYADRKYKNIPQTGEYNLNDLPGILKVNNVDSIFIPSVWPETFSFTTSEAMLMGFPVISFNLGAQAERVSKYPLGLVLDLNDVAENFITKIFSFLNSITKSN